MFTAFVRPLNLIESMLHIYFPDKLTIAGYSVLLDIYLARAVDSVQIQTWRTAIPPIGIDLVFNLSYIPIPQRSQYHFFSPCRSRCVFLYCTFMDAIMQMQV